MVGCSFSFLLKGAVIQHIAMTFMHLIFSHFLHTVIKWRSFREVCKHSGTISESMTLCHFIDIHCAVFVNHLCVFNWYLAIKEIPDSSRVHLGVWIVINNWLTHLVSG